MVLPGTIPLALGVGVSVLLSAFFSMSETALLTVSRTRLRFLADQGNKRARLALSLLQRPRRLLATILIGNTIVNIVASVLTTALALHYFGGNVALAISTGVLTLVLLVGGEITPKSFANEHAEWTALRVARPVRILAWVAYPIERSFSFVSKGLLRATGASRMRPVQFHTEEEIKVLLRVGRERGHIEAREAEMIRAIFEFNDLEVADVMRAAAEVYTVSEDQPLADVVRLVGRTGKSRFPVVDPATGKPRGLVYVKDLLLLGADQTASMKVSAILRPLPLFPPDHRVGAALQRLQTAGHQMAGVVDAAGGLLGIVTIEDILEEIVGEISDEYEVAKRRLARDRAGLVADRIREAESKAVRPEPAPGAGEPPTP